MDAITAIGLDIAKSVFQIHGIDAEGEAVTRRQLRRSRVLPFFAKLPPWLCHINTTATQKCSALPCITPQQLRHPTCSSLQFGTCAMFCVRSDDVEGIVDRCVC
jgi:hypothetical protein